jgi:cell division septation protein DedD
MTPPRDDERADKKRPTGEDRPQVARRGRGRYATTSADHRLSRPMVIALVGVVAVASYFFWPRGGGVRVGTVDPVHVVRVDTTMVAPAPRSGEVDLGTARQPLVAEPQSHEQTTARDIPLDLRTRVEPEPQPAPAPAETVAASPPAPVPEPTAQGNYALQVASFESEAGALELRDDLTTKGYPVHVRAASVSGGAIVYRVWVGYFASRDDAAAYGAAQGETLAGATPVHR